MSWRATDEGRTGGKCIGRGRTPLKIIDQGGGVLGEGIASVISAVWLPAFWAGLRRLWIGAAPLDGLCYSARKLQFVVNKVQRPRTRASAPHLKITGTLCWPSFDLKITR